MISKRGQIHISFGMIFSIIMIVVFIGFAFFAIQQFLGIQREVQEAKFYDGLQKDINEVWNSPKSTQEKSYTAPSSIGEICFIDSATGENLITYDKNGVPFGSREILNIALTEIIASGEPCFENINGKINLVLRKDFDDVLVMVEHLD